MTKIALPNGDGTYRLVIQDSKDPNSPLDELPRREYALELEWMPPGMPNDDKYTFEDSVNAIVSAEKEHLSGWSGIAKCLRTNLLDRAKFQRLFGHIRNDGTSVAYS